MPNQEVSTAEAYKALDLLSYEFKKLPCSFSYPISKDDFPNDFERICKNTLVDSLLDIYKDKAFVSLSGSGSGCFVLARKDDVDFLESIAPFEYIKARIL